MGAFSIVAYGSSLACASLARLGLGLSRCQRSDDGSAVEGMS